MYDIAKLAQEEELKVIFHTNRAIQPEPLRELLKYMDAVVVDLKEFTDEFYTKLSSAKLEPVPKTLKIIKNSKTFEIFKKACRFLLFLFGVQLTVSKII